MSDTVPFYHIRVTTKEGASFAEYDFDYDDIRRLASNFNKGNRISLGDELISPADMKSIRIIKTSKEAYRYFGTDWFTERVHMFREGWGSAKNVTNNFLTFEQVGQGPQAPKSDMPAQVLDQQPKTVYDPKKIFIVHGHDESSKTKLSNFLWGWGLEPIILADKVDEGLTTIIQKFQNHSEKVGYVFGFLTPDDACTSNGGRIASDIGHFPTQKPKLIARARQNVILELGYFMGKLGLDKVCCLWKEEVEPPSDMGGLIFLKFKNDIDEIKYDIHQKLSKAGYELKV